MSSMRDAMKRLQVIYDNCAPEAIEKKAAESELDEFTRLKKKIHVDVKAVREVLKDREGILSRGGTTTESAEMSYRIRVMIRGLKESASAMQDLANKEAKKKSKKDPLKSDKMKENVALCKQHIEECENLEKRRFNEKYNSERVELMKGLNNDDDLIPINKANGSESELDPFATDLPDIDVEEDLNTIKARNKLIDQDLEEIGAGVNKLREIAVGMGSELDGQNEQLTKLEQGVDDAVDHVDNLNVSMKKALDGFMKGDKFMVNCILVCILLAIVAFIANTFVNPTGTLG